MHISSKLVGALLLLSAQGLEAFTLFVVPTQPTSQSLIKASRRSFTSLTATKEADVELSDDKNKVKGETVEEKAWKVIQDESQKEVDAIFKEAEDAISQANVEMKAADVKEKTEEEGKADVSDVIGEKAEREEEEIDAKTKEKVEVAEAVKEEKPQEVKATATAEPKPDTVEQEVTELVQAIEDEAALLVDEMMDEECEVNEMGLPKDEICVDESTFQKVKSNLKSIVKKTLGGVRTGGGSDVEVGADDGMPNLVNFDDAEMLQGELLEQGWEKRGNASALRRNGEVWKFALSCVFKALKPRKLRKKGASEEEINAAKTEAATYITNGLLRLGPSFVKLVSRKL